MPMPAYGNPRLGLVLILTVKNCELTHFFVNFLVKELIAAHELIVFINKESILQKES